MFRRILCPSDFKERSFLALEKAVQLAHQFGAEITLLNVHSEFMDSKEREMLRVSVDTIKEKYRQAALQTRRKMQKEIEKLHTEDVPLSYLLRGGKPAETILDVAKETDVDLIVMSSDGKDNIGDFIAGTITEHVINHSRCPVLVVPFYQK